MPAEQQNVQHPPYHNLASTPGASHQMGAHNPQAPTQEKESALRQIEILSYMMKDIIRSEIGTRAELAPSPGTVPRVHYGRKGVKTAV